MKKCIVINDLSGLGKCSLTASIPVMACLGVQVCPLPTAVLSNQTGYQSYYIDDYTNKMGFILEEWQKRNLKPNAILSGFLANEKQVEIVCDCVKLFKNENTLFVVDPVMGDCGVMYKTHNQKMCESITKLSFMADVITPNLTEACILLKKDPTQNYTLNQVFEMAKELTQKGPNRVIITGVLAGDKIDNVIAENGEVSCISNELIKGNYSGTGDLIASTITAALINTNHTLKEIMTAAANFVGKATYDAYQEKTDRNDGVPFEKHLLELMGNLL